MKGAKMETKIINDIAIVKSNEIIIKDVQSAIDFIWLSNMKQTAIK